MKQETTWSVCPVVRRGPMQLYQRVSVGGGEDKFIPFTREILWLRESTASVVIRHDDVEVKEQCTLNDFYGFLSSLTGAIEDDVTTAAKWLKVGIGDRLAVEVDVTVTERPVMEDTSEDAKQEAIRHAGKNYRKTYLEIPRYRNGGPWFTSDKPESEEKYAAYPVLEAATVAELKGAFSTRIDPLGVVPAKLSKWIESMKANT